MDVFLQTLQFAWIEWVRVTSSHDSALGHYLWPKISILSQGNSKLAHVLSILVKHIHGEYFIWWLAFCGWYRKKQEGVGLVPRDGISL